MHASYIPPENSCTNLTSLYYSKVQGHITFVNDIQNFIQHPAIKVNPHCRWKFVGIVSVVFDAAGQLLITYCAFVKYLRKKWEYNESMHQLFIDLQKSYDTDRMGVLYNILIEFGITMNLIRLIKTCLNEANCRIQVEKHLSQMFLIQNGLKQGDALSPLIFNFSLEYAIREFM
jgi:hypothetical protein